MTVQSNIHLALYQLQVNKQLGSEETRKSKNSFLKLKVIYLDTKIEGHVTYDQFKIPGVKTFSI